MKSEITNLENVLSVVPASLRFILNNALKDISHKIQEIVLRSEKPLCVSMSGKQYVVTKRGTLSLPTLAEDPVIVTALQVLECFNCICNYSVYSHISEIKEGFITLKGGHRAALSGTAVISEGTIINIRDISTISLRIAREIKGVGEKLAKKVSDSMGGLLICGMPLSGKTTLLRDTARILSQKYNFRVALVDSRSELAAISRGVAMNDVGLCDVLNGYPRYDGICQAVRCLSPEFIFCDEIGSDKDAEALIKGVNSGVRFVSTVHADNKNELLTKPYIRNILETGAFENIVFLKGRQAPGDEKHRYTLGEILCD